MVLSRGDAGSDANLINLFLVRHWKWIRLNVHTVCSHACSFPVGSISHTVCLLVLSLNKLKAPQGWAWGYLATGISPAKSTVPDPKQAPNK